MGGSSFGEKATAGGGISPEQKALADYTFGQDEVANAQQFGAHGMGMSTGATQSDIGAFAKQALSEGLMSEADRKAKAAFIDQQVAGLTSGLSSGLGGLGSLLGGGGVGG